MEIYTWGKLDSEHKFTLWILDSQPRFENEGILQSVELHLSNFISYETTFGREFAYDYFKNMTKDNISQYIGEYDYMKSEFSYELSNEEFDEFKCWLLTSLTPIVKQRKEKIGRIKTKIDTTI